MHRAVSRRLSLLDHVIDDRSFIGNGIRVRHRADIGEAAMRCRSSAGLDGLLVFEAGIAQMNVYVHEPWESQRTASIEHLHAFGRLDRFFHARNDAIFDKNVTLRIQPDSWVDRTHTFKQIIHRLPLLKAGR